MLVGDGSAAVGARPAPSARSPMLPGPARRRPWAPPLASTPRLPGGTVYTDDKAPVEWLVDKSIVEYAADGE